MGSCINQSVTVNTDHKKFDRNVTRRAILYCTELMRIGYTASFYRAYCTVVHTLRTVHTGAYIVHRKNFRSGLLLILTSV